MRTVQVLSRTFPLLNEGAGELVPARARRPPSSSNPLRSVRAAAPYGHETTANTACIARIHVCVCVCVCARAHTRACVTRTQRATPRLKCLAVLRRGITQISPRCRLPRLSPDPSRPRERPAAACAPSFTRARRSLAARRAAARPASETGAPRTPQTRGRSAATSARPLCTTPTVGGRPPTTGHHGVILAHTRAGAGGGRGGGHLVRRPVQLLPHRRGQLLRVRASAAGHCGGARAP